ncbi:uncharacterized protein LOC112051849 [Bicyclus anynana]|uniref:Uncharacterized protein LOC112051849 n=1 Tax=Bicyclus anynana TaxID=110368 RepID=A0ABM3LWY9_BICAN|nr:uncharacterized protein LOC112051849 [Bicyclus anynana]
MLAFDATISPKSRFGINLRKNLRAVKKRALVIWLFLVMDGIAFGTTPLLRPGRHFAVDLYIIYGKKSAYCLEPMFESPNFEIATVLTSISIAFCVYIMVNGAACFIVIFGYIEVQILTISTEVTNLWEDSQNFYNYMKDDKQDEIHTKEEIINEYIRIRLRKIIDYHVTNINLFREINNEFCNTVAIEYGIMCVAIVAELLGGLEHTYLQVSFSVVLILIDCLSGQKLIDACNTFEEALYSCQWENFSANNQRSIYLMLLMTQKTLKVSAGGIASLDFNCLMIIFKFSYSAYTTLKSRIQH